MVVLGDAVTVVVHVSITTGISKKVVQYDCPENSLRAETSTPTDSHAVFLWPSIKIGAIRPIKTNGFLRSRIVRYATLIQQAGSWGKSCMTVCPAFCLKPGRRRSIPMLFLYRRTCMTFMVLTQALPSIPTLHIRLQGCASWNVDVTVVVLRSVEKDLRFATDILCGD